jgi:phosphatidylserine/phosphatidylglycerophosphate/cardiolipin synthase-like enzyme
VLSSHHEKLVLVDAQCPRHAVGFVGGFDIARGRYDQPLHQIPLPYFELNRPPRGTVPPRFTGPEVQPLVRGIRFLWHDVQLELAGPCVQQLQLHFAQRWKHAFGLSIAVPEPPPTIVCRKPSTGAGPGATATAGCAVELVRCWRGVMDVQRLFEAHRQMLRRAKRTLYIEHQYPFHNWALTYELCEALRANPGLRVLIVTAVKVEPWGEGGIFAQRFSTD